MVLPQKKCELTIYAHFVAVRIAKLCEIAFFTHISGEFTQILLFGNDGDNHRTSGPASCRPVHAAGCLQVVHADLQ